jgi:hypothetical protein
VVFVGSVSTESNVGFSVGDGSGSTNVGSNVDSTVTVAPVKVEGFDVGTAVGPCVRDLVGSGVGKAEGDLVGR